jgi:hypothetical protein
MRRRGGVVSQDFVDLGLFRPRNFATPFHAVLPGNPFLPNATVRFFPDEGLPAIFQSNAQLKLSKSTVAVNQAGLEKIYRQSYDNIRFRGAYHARSRSASTGRNPDFWHRRVQ